MKPPKSRKAELGSNATGGGKSHAETAESAEFKMTELGPIPVDWEVKRLGEIGTFKNGISKGAESFGHGVPFVNLLDVFGKNRLISACGLGLVDVSHAEIADCGLKQGDTLFVRSSVKPEGVGLATVIDGELSNTVFSGFLLRYRTDELVTGYKRYAFAEANFRQRIIASSTISANTNINQAVLRKLFVIVPPLPEQRKIAEALSDVDELISALGKLIEKKRNIKTGTMQELLGMRNEECGMRNVPRRRLAGFSGAWVEMRLGDCGSFSKGAGISRAQANSGRIPAVRYGELYTTHHEYIKVFESFISEDVARCSTRLTRGDIVFACSGETKEEIGKCAAFLGDEVAYAGGDLLILSPKEAYDSKFLAFELNTPFCASQKAAAGQGDAVVHIRQHSLEELIIRIPPTLAEQQAIATVLSDMDAEIAALEADHAKYESIKSGMMQELLTGKTRLKGA